MQTTGANENFFIRIGKCPGVVLFVSLRRSRFPLTAGVGLVFKKLIDRNVEGPPRNRNRLQGTAVVRMPVNIQGGLESGELL